MTSNKSVALSIVPENGVLVILPWGTVRKYQVIHNQVIQKSISMEFLHALYTDMTQTAVPQISCTIIINFGSFGFNIMKMCITTTEIQQTIFIGCMTIEGFYSCKQNNNLFSYLNE